MITLLLQIICILDFRNFSNFSSNLILLPILGIRTSKFFDPGFNRKNE